MNDPRYCGSLIGIAHGESAVCGRDYYVTVYQCAECIKRERDELHAEVETLRQDATRYRWLKENARTGFISFGSWCIDAYQMRDDWDCIIDAAMSEEGTDG